MVTWMHEPAYQRTQQLSTQKLRNTAEKSDFVIFHTKLLTSVAYKLKHFLSYFTHRMTSLSFQYPLSARLSEKWQEYQFWLAAVLRSCNVTPFWATKKRSKFRRTYCTCTVLMLVHFTTLPTMVAFEVLTKSLSIRHLVAHNHALGIIPSNLYLSVSTVTVLSWRRGFLSWCVEYVPSTVEGNRF